MDGAPIKLDYDHAEWSRRCTTPMGDGILLCPNMRAMLRALAVDLADDSARVVERRRNGSTGT
jgi:hypothetical protein